MEKKTDSSFFKKYDTFRTQATSLTNKYKDLQARFHSAETDLRNRFRELKAREDRIGVKEKEEAEKCKSTLLSLKSLIKKHLDELNALNERVKEKRELCEVTQNRVDRLKRDEVSLIEKSIAELREERVREMELRAKEVERLMEEWRRRVELKERELEELCGRFELRGGEFEPRVVELGVIEKRVEECLNEVVVRERSLERLEKSIQEREKSVELGSCKLKEKAKEFELYASQVHSDQLEKEKHYASLEKSMEEREKTLDALEKSMQEREKDLESGLCELKMKEGQLEEQAKEFESKQIAFASQVTEQLEREKHFTSLEKLIQERQETLDSLNKSLEESKEHSERLLELQGRELQSKQKLDLYEQLGFEEKIPDIIRNLIERKQLIEAVRLICTFKLNDEFPPLPHLRELVEDAKKCCTEIFSEDMSLDEKEKVVDDRIADLQAVIHCISDHGLEPQYPSIDIMMHIQGLQKQLPRPPIFEKQEQRKRKKASPSSAPANTYKLRKRT